MRGGTRTDLGALSKKRAFFNDASRLSPELVSNLRMFSCHSCSAISDAVSSEEKALALRIALMRLCGHGAVSEAYLMINAVHASAPFMSVTLLNTASAGPLTFITKTWKRFLDACNPLH